MTRTLKWWIAIAAVVVFFAGAAVGLFGGAVHVRQQHMMMIRHGPRVGEPCSRPHTAGRRTEQMGDRELEGQSRSNVTTRT